MLAPERALKRIDRAEAALARDLVLLQQLDRTLCEIEERFGGIQLGC